MAIKVPIKHDEPSQAKRPIRPKFHPFQKPVRLQQRQTKTDKKLRESVHEILPFVFCEGIKVVFDKYIRHGLIVLEAFDPKFVEMH